MSRRSWLPILCLWIGFLSYSFCHAPIPGVNEPHYLTKSMHYWDPDWCVGDFFLESSNAHLVFYQTVGALTVCTSFENAALIGRVLAYLLLAVAWQRLCTSVTDDCWSGCVAAAVFLLLASIGNFSGEWLVGGGEAKVFAYGFVLAGMASLLKNELCPAALLFGCGVAMHPLVGLWSVVALSMSVAWSLSNDWRISGIRCQILTVRNFVRRPDVFVSAALFGGVAAWGVVPALTSVLSADSTMSFAGNYIQVFYRLPHHLDPMAFGATSYIGYGMLALVAWLLNRGLPANSALRFLSRTIVCSGIIAFTGVLIGLGPRPPEQMPFYVLRMNLLKFYPFRLFDVGLPILVSIHLAYLLSDRRLLSVLLPAGSRVIITGVCFGVALYLNAGLGSIDRMTDIQRADWLDVCGWLKENSTQDALVLTPKESRAFKWFAERPEYVAFKDCPQDAAGIVEWNRRLRFLRDWGQDNWNGRSYSAAVTHELHETTGITHIVSKRFGPFDVPIVYRNSTYRIYRIDGTP
ncbi:MAG: hypothetical protein O3B13_02045 [Planctomycetota bacterium]|nr:hypothetical protein [Planctomycetota bacterium]